MNSIYHPRALSYTRKVKTKAREKKRDFSFSFSSSDEVVKLQPIIEHGKQLFFFLYIDSQENKRKNERTTRPREIRSALRQSAVLDENTDEEKEKIYITAQ